MAITKTDLDLINIWTLMETLRDGAIIVNNLVIITIIIIMQLQFSMVKSRQSRWHSHAERQPRVFGLTIIIIIIISGGSRGGVIGAMAPPIAKSQKIKFKYLI